MKVFAFNPVTGRKGALIGDIARPDHVSNRQGAQCQKPPSRDDEDWMVATVATDRNNKRVAFEHPVCFCLGKFTAGTDSAWQWVILLPEGDDAKNHRLR